MSCDSFDPKGPYFLDGVDDSLFPQKELIKREAQLNAAVREWFLRYEILERAHYPRGKEIMGNCEWIP